MMKREDVIRREIQAELITLFKDFCELIGRETNPTRGNKIRITMMVETNKKNISNIYDQGYITTFYVTDFQKLKTSILNPSRVKICMIDKLNIKYTPNPNQIINPFIQNRPNLHQLMSYGKNPKYSHIYVDEFFKMFNPEKKTTRRSQLICTSDFSTTVTNGKFSSFCMSDINVEARTTFNKLKNLTNINRYKNDKLLYNMIMVKSINV